jgi:predicted ATP-grasp superfamily ATP-dependent carboligase
VRILLPDGDERSSLAAARSLIAAGHQVLVARARRFELAPSTRGVRPVTVGSVVGRDPIRFATSILALAAEHEIDLLLPVTDASVEALLPRAGELPRGTRLPFPALPSWRIATDKDAVLALAQEAGLDVPETWRIPVPDETLVLPDPAFFPAVLKPHRSVVAGASTNGGPLRVVPVADRATCLRVLRRMPAAAYPVLLQRQVDGPGEGLFLLRWKGRIVAAFAHRRLREKPPWGGVSVFRESIPLPPALLAAGTRLLERLDWEGVAMIECKYDLARGRHVLMEINGRLWGSLQLAIDAGVDFPRLLAECAAGSPPAAVTSYRTGVRSRWFWGDLDHLYLRMRHGPARLAALRAFLYHVPGRDREEIWRWRDPLPFIAESARRLGLR